MLKSNFPKSFIRFAKVTMVLALLTVSLVCFSSCVTIYKIHTPGYYVSLENVGYNDTELKIKERYFGLPVSEIGYNVFLNHRSLEVVEIPSTVTRMSDKTFLGCSSLIEIKVDEDNPVYKSIDGNLYSRDGTILYQYAIGKTDVHFDVPDTVTLISPYAFADCKYLTSITLPNGLIEIDEYAFAGCNNLTGINIPESVNVIGKRAFERCESITSLEFLGSVELIDDKAFLSCSSLNSIAIHEDFVFCDKDAFSECSNIESIHIGDHVTQISFLPYINSIKNIDVSEGNAVYKSIDGNLYSKDGRTLILYAIGKDDIVFEVPSGVTKIGERAFMYCSNLTNVVISEGVTEIGESAFMYCSNLTNVVIPESIIYIKTYAFTGCSAVTDIVIPDSVTEIEFGAFKGCTNLQTFHIGKNVSSIHNAVFTDCISLVSFSVHEENEYFYVMDDNLYEYYHPYYGYTLKQYSLGKTDSSFVIPAEITYIAPDAFSGCLNLTSIVIQDNVYAVGGYSVFRCPNLTDVYYTGTKEQWDSIKNHSINSLVDVNIHFNYVVE